MRLIDLIPKNVLRQKTRTALTLLGISIGIATILSLGAVADGLKQSMSGVIRAGEGDFIIAQAGSADLMFSRIDQDLVREIRAVDGVAAVEGVSLAVVPYEANPYFFVFGMTERGIEMGGFTLAEGRMPEGNTDEIVLGKVAASTTKKGVGDTLPLFGTTVDVVGIYETGEQLQDGGSLMQQDVVQRHTKSGEEVTMLFVAVDEGVDVAELTKRIDADFENELVTIKNADEVSRADQGIEVMDAASWMISALAIVIGGIGVMNTMIVSVFDRVREIGVLKAVGWRRRTVMLMILGEAVLIGLASIVVGSALAMVFLLPLSYAEVVKSFLQPAYSVGLWARATAVALIVSVVGGLYPAWRAANLSPVEALRYE